MTVMDKDYIRLWGVMGSGEGEGRRQHQYVSGELP